MKKITFVIFTFNEEKRIERVIKNFLPYGNILIADNQSTDKTQSIAKKYGCDILIRTKDYEFVECQHMMEQLSESVTTDWIYWGFADEMLEKKTLEEITKTLDLGKYDIISIDRKNYFHGKFCYNAFASRTNKIFKKGAIDFTNNVIHGFGKAVVSKEKIYQLPDNLFVHHFISNTIESYLNTINRYTNSELKFSREDKGKFVNFILLPIRLFISNLIFKKGYKAGLAGWNLTLISIFYYIVTCMKFNEKKDNLSPIKIEALNNIIRDKILVNINAQ